MSIYISLLPAPYPYFEIGQNPNPIKGENPSNRDEFSRVSACTGFIAMPKFHKPIIIGIWATIDLIKKSF